MEEEILEYFNRNANVRYRSSFLDVLDNKYRKYYTGVTFPYIVYELLKGKYRKSDVAKKLLELHKTNQIKSLRCNDVKQYVFEPLTSGHDNFRTDTGYYHYVTPNASSYNVHIYLQQFIKE